jgi:lysophospholipase L1-like esterase
MRSGNTKRQPKRSLWRKLLFRLVAILLGLSPLLLAELTFRILDWGRPRYHTDPFVGFSDVYPLFVLSDDGTRYEIPPARRAFFCPESFPAAKAPEEFRIFCLGGSTVQGRPFAIQTSFTSWLELSLEAAAPDRAWDVVNCGGVSYASYRLVPILEEVLTHRPDLIILYTGHNEFLEDRTYGHVRDRPALVTRALELATQLRTFVLVSQAVLRLRGFPTEAPAPERPILGGEVDAMLDHRGGLERYRRDETWRRGVIEHFRFNLRRMINMCGDAKVPLILVNPVCNLRDCPPFKVEPRHDLAAEERDRLEALRGDAGDHLVLSHVRAVARLEQAAAIDDLHAGIQYELGKCYDRAGRYADAYQAYLRAKELDVCPLRILLPMQEAILRIGRDTGITVVDIQARFEALSPEGIPGGRWLLDHVHPSILGHQKIAEALLDALVKRGVLEPVPHWQEVRDELYEEHTSRLDDVYYARGMQRLEMVRGWAAGWAGIDEEARKE